MQRQSSQHRRGEPPLVLPHARVARQPVTDAAEEHGHQKLDDISTDVEYQSQHYELYEGAAVVLIDRFAARLVSTGRSLMFAE